MKESVINTASKYVYPINICSLNTTHNACIERNIHIFPTKSITILTPTLCCLMPYIVLPVSA